MANRRSDFWSRWLQAVFVVAAIMGVALALASDTVLFRWITAAIARAFWPEGATPRALEFQRWSYGVFGSTMAAWALMAALLARHAFARRERWARDALAASIALWFVLDTSLSARAGAWANVAFNTAVLVLLLPPILATWREFGDTSDLLDRVLRS